MSTPVAEPKANKLFIIDVLRGVAAAVHWQHTL